MSHLESFNQHRSLLFAFAKRAPCAIAYRMLGTVADAEDMVQETFLRWQQMTEATVKSTKTYLSTIITRFLVALRSKRLATAVSHLIEVNGQPGVMVIMNDRIQSVTTFDIDLYNEKPREVAGNWFRRV